MEQKVKIKEKLIVHILDEDGNIVETRHFSPPSTPLEKIASKLGILKRHNTVTDSGLNALAKRWVGQSQNPVNWLCVRRSHGGDFTTGTWLFRSADVSVTADKAYVSNANNSWNGGSAELWDHIGAASSNSTGGGGYGATGLVSYIDDVDVDMRGLTTGYLWVEIEYDFDTS